MDAILRAAQAEARVEMQASELRAARQGRGFHQAEKTAAYAHFQRVVEVAKNGH